MTSAYEKAADNVKFYAQKRNTWKEFYPSEKYFLTKKFIKPGMSILDIGGGGGGLGNAIREAVEPNIVFECIDADPACIAYGKKHYPDFKFQQGYFPRDFVKHNTYDMVTLFSWFPQLPDWKGTIREMLKLSHQYVNIDLLVKLSGEAIVDIDLSYVYYFDSHQRVHQVVLNLLHLVNFLSIEEFQVRKLTFFGYHVLDKKAGCSNRSEANKDIIRGNILIEKYGEGYPGRLGAHATYKETFHPEVRVIIDGRKVQIQ